MARIARMMEASRLSSGSFVLFVIFVVEISKRNCSPPPAESGGISSHDVSPWTPHRLNFVLDIRQGLGLQNVKSGRQEEDRIHKERALTNQVIK